MPYPSRGYLVYVDDSGNEDVGWLWTALAIPAELWTDHLGRWLNFRSWLYNRYEVPANFELHSQVWLSVEPEKETDDDQLALVRTPAGELIDVLRKGKDRRRARFEIYEKAVKTVGSLPDAALFTTFTSSAKGPAKSALYDDLLCFIEEFLLVDRAHATCVVDGLEDGGGHLRASHRGLRIRERRVLEDPSLRSSADSQLLQMADCCVYAALQSIQQRPTLDQRFIEQYERVLSRRIVRPDGVDEGRCIRGRDYAANTTGCPSDRIAP